MMEKHIRMFILPLTNWINIFVLSAIYTCICVWAGINHLEVLLHTLLFTKLFI